MFDYYDIGDITFGEIGTELGCGGVVWLDSDNLINAVGQSTGNNPRAGADFYYGIALFEIGMPNKHEC